jgi:hypothetical protein
MRRLRVLHATLRGWQMGSTWPRCRSRSPARVVATAVLPLAWGWPPLQTVGICRLCDLVANPFTVNVSGL